MGKDVNGGGAPQEGNAGGKTPVVKKIVKEWSLFNTIVVAAVVIVIFVFVILIFAS